MEPQQLSLRDIHIPDPIIWWPPALGWWLLLASFFILILALFLLRRWLLKRHKEPKRIARRELKKLQIEYQQHQNPQILVQKISTLLRRVCISYYPRADVAALTGKAWLQFLDKLVENKPFTQGQGRCLIDAPYIPRKVDIDVDGLFKLCRTVMRSKFKSPSTKS